VLVAVLIVSLLLVEQKSGNAHASATTTTTAAASNAARTDRSARTERGGGSGRHAKTHRRKGAVHTSLGPWGVVSSAVVAENAKRGTTAWQITGSAPGFIEGFADHDYAADGDTIGLYVSTSAPTYAATAYRMGYYGGTGARKVWASATLHGVSQPPCPNTPGVNMVSCDNWSRSLTVTLNPAFVPGVYLFKLVGSGGQQAYVPLTVWDPSSTAAYLVMGRTLTEEGWNTFGGYSYYQGMGPCPAGAPSYPVCNRARVASFDRPYAEGNGSSDFLSNDYPLVRFCEQHGLDATYVSDVTVDEHPDLVLHHKVLLSTGHDETWTYAERQGAQNAYNHGVNMVFFGAAAVLRHSRLQASPLGPDREEVNYRDSAADPLDGGNDKMNVTGNTWSSPPSSWSEVGFTGEIYSGYMLSGSASLVVWNPSSWLFRGTGLGAGAAVPGVIESDIDHVDGGGTVPPGLEVLAHSPVPVSESYTNQGTWGGYTYADTTYFTDPATKAGVFDSGTVNWVNELTPCTPGQTPCAAPTVARMTGNLLRVFGQGPVGDLAPSTANWQAVTPAGS
jgi:hypothetical protein